MNNLSQKHAEAKRTYLLRQQNELLARYQDTSDEDRETVIRHIDSLLKILEGDERKFWETFRNRLLALSSDYGVLDAEVIG